MSRWWRAYDEAVDNPKLIGLTDEQHRFWFNILCVCSEFGGSLPDIRTVSIKVRMQQRKVVRLLNDLQSAGLMDEANGLITPHNWERRQFKSDVSTERVKRFRKRIGNVSGNVSETPPETDNRKQSSEAKASDAGASSDPRTRLFNEGLAKLSFITGKGPDACRSFVGKCLKAAGDDAVVVLGLIEEAERNRAVDPSGWIASRLKGANSNGTTGSKIIQAADDLRRKIAGFDGPAGEDIELRGGSSPAVVRMLPNG